MPYVSEEYQQAMRQRILKSTYKLYIRDGEKMLTQDVCSDAGISKGTLFHYFPTKEQLLWEAFHSAHEHARRIAYDEIDFERPDWETRDLVKQVIVKAIRWGCDFPDEVIFSERYNDSRHSDLLSSEFHERVQGMFDHPVLRARVLAHAPEAYREYLNILINNMAFILNGYIARNPEKAKDEDYIEFVVETFWRIFG